MSTTKRTHVDVVLASFVVVVLLLIAVIIMAARVYEIRVAEVLTPYSPENTTAQRLIVAFTNPIRDKRALENNITLTPSAEGTKKYFVGERLVIESRLPFELESTYTLALAPNAVPGMQGFAKQFSTPSYTYAALVGSGAVLVGKNTETLKIYESEAPIESMQKIVGTSDLLYHTILTTKAADALNYVNTRAGIQKTLLEVPNERILGYSGYVDGQYMVQVQRRNMVDGLIGVGLFLGNMAKSNAPDIFWFQAVFGSSFSFTPEGTGILGKGESSILYIPLEDKPTEVLYIGKSDQLFDTSHDGGAILTGTYSGEGVLLSLLLADAPLQSLTTTPYRISSAKLLPGNKGILFVGNIDPTAGPKDPTHVYRLDIETKAVTQLTFDPLWKEVSFDISADGMQVILERQRPVSNAESELWLYTLDTDELTPLNQQGSSPLFLP